MDVCTPLPRTMVKNAAIVRMSETLHNPVRVELSNHVSVFAELVPVLLGLLHKPWMKSIGAVGV